MPADDDAFVIDTRRSKGNRRALPQRPRRPDEGSAQAIPVRGEGDAPRQGKRRQQGEVPPDAPRDGRTSRPLQGAPQGGRPQRPQDSARSAAAAPRDDSTRVMPTSGRPERPVRPVRGRSTDAAYVPAGAAGGYGADAGRDGFDAHDGNGGRPPRGPRPGDRFDGDGSGQPPRRPRRRGKKILAGVLALLILWVGTLVWAGNSAWSKVKKLDAVPAQHLAEDGKGRNILLVGSDARTGLTPEQRKKLGTGTAEGKRTDSIMVLHMGGDKPTLMSIPRDSYVDIPGYGKNKINAAFSFGDAPLLVKTIEQNTGIHIDNYMEIGFGGFASVVDTVGGVNICVKNDMDDPKAHINLKKGCQDMDGATALGYVRARYSDPEGDIGRAKRQRQFLGALMGKVSSPANILVPWRLKGLGESSAQGLAVDKDMGMITAARVMLTLKKLSGDGGNSVVVPISNNALPTAVGEAVEWDQQKSQELFKAIRENGDTSKFVVKTPAAAN